MAIFVETTDDNSWYIANDPTKFLVETNIPFPGFIRITCEDGTFRWFNAAHVITIGNRDMGDISTMEPN